MAEPTVVFFRRFPQWSAILTGMAIVIAASSADALANCDTPAELERREIVLDYLRALDAGGDVGALLHENVIATVPKHPIAYGKEDVLKMFERFGTLTGPSRHDYAQLNFFCSGATIVVEGTSAGTTANGRKWGPNDAASGGRFADVIEIRDGRIARLFMYLDPDYGGATAQRYPWLTAE